MKRSSRIIAIMMAMLMVLSTSVAFAGETQVSEVKAYTVDYMFDIDSSAEHTTIYYSDEMLADSSSVFNEHLATASMGLCLAAGGDNDSSIKKLLGAMGFNKFQSNYTKAVAREDNIAFAYASKNYNGTTIIPVVIRGSHYQNEWYDNFHAGTSGDAKGFSSAASTVVSAVNKYVSELGTKKVKIWVTGYSRGAGVADLACDSLTAKYGKDKVYGYCNEAPMTNKGNDKKANIHHVNNIYDGVTCVLPTYMGFGYAGTVNAKVGDLGKEDAMKTMLQKVVKENVSTMYKSPSGFCWAKVDTSNLLNLASFPTKYVSAGDAKAFWSTLIGRIKRVIPDRATYTKVYSANVTAAAKSMGVEAKSIEESFRGIAEYIMTMSDSDKAKFETKIGSALMNTVLSLGILSNPLINMIDEKSGNVKLTAKDYTTAVKAFSDSMGLDNNMRACVAGGFDPLIKLLDLDFANPNTQILGSFLYQDNKDRLIYPHGLEVTMAWLMTEDSNFNGDGKVAKVTPATPVKKLKAAKKAVAVSWEPVEGATGYQIQYSLKSSYKSAKTVKVASATAKSKKISKLKAKKKYYVRVRAYNSKKLYGVSRTVYGSWSKGSIKTK